MTYLHVSVYVVLFACLIDETATVVITDNNNITEVAQPVLIKSPRFLLFHNSTNKWASWQQRVSCLTTCVKGYEQQTIACCSSGDNRLCFNLPWTLLNNSVGHCKGFCQRKEEISCNMPHSPVCGSDRKLYENRCEFTKAACSVNGLLQRDIKFCNTLSGTTEHFTTSGQSPLSHTSSEPKVSYSAVSVRSSLQTTTVTANTALVQSSNTSNVTAAISTDAITKTTTTPQAPTVPAFCQNKHSISCGVTFNIVCGSDGKYYANLCMLALGRCDNPSLKQKDMQYCATGG